MTATVVRTSSSVRAGARSTVFVSQEIQKTMFKIMGAYMPPQPDYASPPPR